MRARGAVKCGISQAAGFATPNDAGQWQGFDVDFCKAIAVAVFGDTAKVEFVPYTQSQRFSGLQSGEVDVLVNGTSLTISRAMLRGFHFGPVYLYDGQAFLVPKALNVSKAASLDGATVCVQQGTTTELNLADFARRNNIKFRPVVIEDHRGAVAALAGGRCDVITQDGAGLATTRTMLRNPNDYVVLPDRISKEPIAPVIRYGDDQWLELINWVFRVPVQAEELGITRANVASTRRAPIHPVRRFLGMEPGVTDGFGLDARWTSRVIEQRRQLRRDLRSQPRTEDAARHDARPECAVDGRRPDVRATVPVRQRSVAVQGIALGVASSTSLVAWQKHRGDTRRRTASRSASRFSDNPRTSRSATR